jgi:hypothetical protein
MEVTINATRVRKMHDPGDNVRVKNENPSGRKRSKVTWIPVHASQQDGRRVTLTGTARSRLSEKIIARRSTQVKNLQKHVIGELQSIKNDGGALTVQFVLNEGAVNPGGKFLLGLHRKGLHVGFYLSAVAPGPEDGLPQAYPGMLGEEF